NRLAFSGDGRLLASGSWDRKVKIWDARRDPKATVLRGHVGFVAGVAFSPDGGRLASVGLDGGMKVWDLATGQAALGLPARMGILSQVGFSPDGSRLLACSNSAAVKTWDASTGKELDFLNGPSRNRVSAVALSPCGSYVAWAREDNAVVVRDLTTGQV